MYQFIPITHPTLDTQHPLLLLQADSGEKYFFGKLSEGSQRACNESKIKFGKLNGIFLTGEMDWSCIGGLPGMILTASDQGKKDIRLFYGSNILSYVVSTWRYFVFRFGLDLKIFSLPDKEGYKDSNIQVKSVVVSKADNGSGISSEIADSFLSGLRKIVGSMFPDVNPSSPQESSLNQHLNVEIPLKIARRNQVSTSYEISFPSIRGKFNVKRALELGVPKGKLFADLAKGMSVTLENGTVVEPHHVLSPNRDFAKVLILDIPSNAYIRAFKERFVNYPLESVGAVYYFLGNDVRITQDFFNFMEYFDGENIQHFVSHPNISPNTVAFESSTIATLKLKALQKNCYNVPITDRVYSKEFFECFEKSLPIGTSVIQQQEEVPRCCLKKENVQVFEKSKGIALEPYTLGVESLKIKASTLPTTKLPSTLESLYNGHVEPLGIHGASLQNTVRDEYRANNFNNEEKKNKIEIVTLGTGSALPSKYRNVISTFMKIPYVEKDGSIVNRNIILDAGENTLGSIKRIVPSTELPSLFKDLKMIYLSHLHADHHLGIASLINEWYFYNKDTDNKLFIVTPWQYEMFVKEWFALQDLAILDSINYINCEHLKYGEEPRRQLKPLPFPTDVNENKRRRLEADEKSTVRNVAAIKAMMKELRILSFNTCPAIHCDWAYSSAISFFMKSNSKKVFKVSYSGDTRPNFGKFAKGIGRGSDLLIHEATLENDLLKEAIKKNHSTINEAISVSNAMEAEKLLLTHFSQRYPKVPNMTNNIELKAKELCFAFDGMIISFDELGQQQDILDDISRVFAEEQNEADHEEKN